MLRFRSCPKCQGDLRQDTDRFSTFFSCLQCGYVKELGATVEEWQKERRTRRNKVT